MFDSLIDVSSYYRLLALPRVMIVSDYLESFGTTVRETHGLVSPSDPRLSAAQAYLHTARGRSQIMLPLPLSSHLALTGPWHPFLVPYQARTENSDEHWAIVLRLFFIQFVGRSANITDAVRCFIVSRWQRDALQYEEFAGLYPAQFLASSVIYPGVEAHSIPKDYRLGQAIHVTNMTLSQL